MRAPVLALLVLCAGNVECAPELGELLYENHCIACHQREIHWRDKSVVRDWTSLVAQVDRWQKYGGLNWDAGEVAATARYLNSLHYRLPAQENP